MLQVQTSNYQPLNTYVYGVQRIENEKANDANTFYQYNGRGSVLGQNKNGTPEKLAFQIKYDDFGQTNRKTDNEFGYNAESHDYNNMQYLRARYYDTGTGRFNQQDSYLGTLDESISQNRYTYTHNNSINNTDPSGHWSKPLTCKEYNKLDSYSQERYRRQFPNPCQRNTGGREPHAPIVRPDTNKGGNSNSNNGGNNPYTPDGNNYTQEQADDWSNAEWQRFIAMQDDALRRAEAEALAKAHGLNVKLADNLSGADLLRIIKQIIKICAEVRMGVSVAEAQAKANALVPDPGETGNFGEIWTIIQSYMPELIDVAKIILDIVTGMIPFLGGFLDVLYGILGKNLITGREMGVLESIGSIIMGMLSLIADGLTLGGATMTTMGVKIAAKFSSSALKIYHKGLRLCVMAGELGRIAKRLKLYGVIAFWFGKIGDTIAEFFFGVETTMGGIMDALGGSIV